MFEEIKRKLKKYISADSVVLTRRGNAAILLALKHAQKLGKTKVLIQDQGGWLTYLQFPTKLGMELIKIPTDYGLVSVDELQKHIDSDSVLLINSMPGYHCYQEMEELYDLCKNIGCLVINDVTGSLGTDSARYGDILVGSFGKWKPVDVGYGGFIAGNDLDLADEFDPDCIAKTIQKLEELPERVASLQKRQEAVKAELEGYEIIHKDFIGFNVIAKFIKESDHPALVEYCEGKNLPFTLCPRYIRINEPGISIELKR